MRGAAMYKHCEIPVIYEEILGSESSGSALDGETGASIYVAHHEKRGLYMYTGGNQL